MEGLLLDELGLPVADATVKLGSQTRSTDDEGRFYFSGVPAGKQQLSAALTGFVPLDATEIEVIANRTASLEFYLLRPNPGTVLPNIDQAPLKEARSVTTVGSPNLDEMPGARDPWVVLQGVRGVQVDRINVGGNESGEFSRVHLSDGGSSVFAIDGMLLPDFDAPGAAGIDVTFLKTGAAGSQLMYLRSLFDPQSGFVPGTAFPVAPGTFAGPADRGGGWMAFQNLDTHYVDVYDLKGQSPVSMGRFPTGGFQNSLFTGGHDAAIDFVGPYTLRGLFDRARMSDVKDLGNGCTQFFPSSELVVKTEVFDPATGMFENTDTQIVGTRQGPFGPGCFSNILYTGAFGLGDLSVFQYRSDDQVVLLGYDGKQLRPPITVPLPEDMGSARFLPNSYSDRTAGVAYSVFPDGIREISEDGLKVGVPLSSIPRRGPRAVVADGIFTSDLSARGSVLSQIGNFDLDDSDSDSDGDSDEDSDSDSDGGSGGSRSDSSGGSLVSGGPAGTPQPAIVHLPGCVDSDRVFCGLGNRFAVKVDWRATNGAAGQGHARPLTGDSGTFWFFARDNREVLVKTLDACAVNGHYWFFAGGLTSVDVDITVQDMLGSGARHYASTGGAFQPVLDTRAFECSAGDMARVAEAESAGVAHSPAADAGTISSAKATGTGTACGGDESSVCLRDGRFRVDVDWSTASASGSGVGGAIAGDTGVFSFFDQGNFEMLVKVLDGCALNDRFWLFAGGLTNVAVDLVVTDTQTGQSKTYLHPGGDSYVPIQDTSAFATCP